MSFETAYRVCSADEKFAQNEVVTEPKAAQFVLIGYDMFFFQFFNEPAMLGITWLEVFK